MSISYREEPERPPTSGNEVARRASVDWSSLLLCDPTRPSPSSSQTNGSLNASLQSPGAHTNNGIPFPVRRSSFAHTFNLAKSCLEANGVVEPAEQNVQEGSNTAARVAIEQPLASDFHHYAEPILHLGYDRARQIFSTFSRTIHPIYPCVDLSAAGWLLDALFGSSTEKKINETSQPPPVSLTRIDILKALLGLTLLVEGDDTSPLALHLQRYIDWTVEKLVMGRGPDIDDIVMATLMVRCHRN